MFIMRAQGKMSNQSLQFQIDHNLEIISYRSEKPNLAIFKGLTPTPKLGKLNIFVKKVFHIKKSQRYLHKIVF